MSTKSISVHHGMDLRDALDAARALGCSVTHKNQSGEIKIKHQAFVLSVNGRRKDAPRELTQKLARITLRATRLDGLSSALHSSLLVTDELARKAGIEPVPVDDPKWDISDGFRRAQSTVFLPEEAAPNEAHSPQDRPDPHPAAPNAAESLPQALRGRLTPPSDPPEAPPVPVEPSPAVPDTPEPAVTSKARARRQYWVITDIAAKPPAFFHAHKKDQFVQGYDGLGEASPYGQTHLAHRACTMIRSRHPARDLVVESFDQAFQRLDTGESNEQQQPAMPPEFDTVSPAVISAHCRHAAAVAKYKQARRQAEEAELALEQLRVCARQAECEVREAKQALFEAINAEGDL